MANNTTSTTTTTTVTTVPAVLDSSIESVTGALSINCLLLILLLAAFDFLVRVPWMRRFLLPKFQPGDTLPGFPLGWVRQVWQQWGAPNDGMNLDALVFVRFCELGFKFSVGGCILDLVLIPMYATGQGEAPGFNAYSLSNLSEGSDRFWGVVVAAYILTGFVLHQMLAEWRRFVILRREHFMRCCRGNVGQELAQARHSVIVESVPPEARSHEAVKQFFEGLFGPGSVHSCMLQQDATQFYLHLDMQKATSCCGCCRGKAPVRALEHVVDRVVDGADGLLRQDFQAQPIAATGDPEAARGQAANIPGMAHVMELGRGVQQLAVGVAQIGQELIVGHAASSTAFVTFHKATHSAAAEQMLLLHGPFWQASAAPEPRDLIWRNVFKPVSQTRFRTMVSQGLLVFGILWWAVPVAFVQTFANASSLQQQVPWLVDFLMRSPTVYAFVTAYLPAMALIGLQALLPIAFEILARKYEGHKTKSEVQIRILNRCFAYQLASLYVTVLSSSVIQAFKEILDHPAEVLQILSDKLPQVAVYFVTFVLARVGTSLPMLLIRPLALLGLAADVQVCYFGAELANVALILVLGLTYSFIAPSILPACALFFGLASIMYRWLFAHVYEPEFDSGGMMWYDLFMCVIVGLFMGTLSLVAITLIKAQKMQAALLLPLPVLVLIFGAHCSWKIGSQSRLAALKDAVSVDEGGGQPPLFSEVAYSDPLLTEFETALQQERASSACAATSVAPVSSEMKT